MSGDGSNPELGGDRRQRPTPIPLTVLTGSMIMQRRALMAGEDGSGSSLWL